MPVPVSPPMTPTFPRAFYTSSPMNIHGNITQYLQHIFDKDGDKMKID